MFLENVATHILVHIHQKMFYSSVYLLFTLSQIFLAHQHDVLLIAHSAVQLTVQYILRRDPLCSVADSQSFSLIW